MLKRIIQAQEFTPSLILGLVLNPFYFSRRAILSAVKRIAPQIKGRVLDVGCGTKPYQQFFKVDQYVGMEIDASRDRLGERVDVYYSGDRFPFEDASFDGLVSFQVLEHVPDPSFSMREMHRVLKPGGLAFITVPFAWEEHESPYDFTRFSSFGIQSRLKKSGFEIVHYEKSCTGFMAIVQIFSTMLTVRVLTWPKLIRYLVQVLVVFPKHLISIFINLFYPKNEKLFLDNIVLVRKI